MDGRDAIPISGPKSYYVQQQRLDGSVSGSQPGLHALPGMRTLSNTLTSMPTQSTTVGLGSVSTGFHVESPSSVTQHGPSVGGQGGGLSQGEPVKRKRGRPRKYRPDGTMSLALSSPSSPMPVPGFGAVGLVIGSVPGSGSAEMTHKRGRGRLAGTGKKQQLASYGGWISSSAGMGFTPHIMTISTGEDIASKIASFSEQGPRSACILSANGAVSTVVLRQPATSGGTITYEGRFEILSLSGSYLPSDSGSRGRSGDLSISLSSADGHIIGGPVGGMLIAASPVQVIVGSFLRGDTKAKKKPKPYPDPDLGGDAEALGGDRQMISPGAPSQSVNDILSAWPGSRPVDARDTQLDIDLMKD